jgi:hypothetical protein
MKKKLSLFSIYLVGLQWVYAQQEISQRIILVGDAGEINATQKAVINNAVSNAIPHKTIAIFLGDNIYPKGMEFTGNKKEKSSKILQSQYESFIKRGIPVYFIPGNHDWDKSGANGYHKMITLNNFIREQQDSLLKIIPSDACPGPYELNINNNITVIAMDTEWWLFPFDKGTNNSDCECKSTKDILGKLYDIIQRNYNKVVVFVTHHPFESNGVHSGHYTIKQHLFPLTELNKKILLPLPGIGSIYPLLRKTFPPAEDAGNILYKNMKASVLEILKQHPNIIHASGHEHTLELIQSHILQIVSGAGSKYGSVKKTKNTLYASNQSGYVIADILHNSNIQLQYYTYNNKVMKPSFTFLKQYTSPTIANTYEATKVNTDSLLTKLLPELDSVSNMHRKLFGENYRKIWAMPTKLPVLNISATSLTPTEMGGGMQTRSLRLIDSNNKEWAIRSIEKFPDALLPQTLNRTLASKLIKDNVSANFPFAPLVVPVIADALSVPHTNPAIVYVSPDKKLGIYSKYFQNTVALLEEREPLGKSLSTLKMQQKLKEDNDNTVDQQAYLTARIQDVFLGDWDRHADQWRWVDTFRGKDKKFKPIPRDRDQVFYINKGLLPGILALPWLMPKFQGFGSTIKNINTFAFNARLIDGLFTNQLNEADWGRITSTVVSALTDSVIDKALQRMPKNIYDYTYTSLKEKLVTRRKDLLRVMPVYYTFLNNTIDITLSDKNELVIIKDTLSGKLKIDIFKLNKLNVASKLIYSRILNSKTTKEIRLYLYGGEDSILIENNTANVRIRIVGDVKATKKYTITGHKKYLRNVHIYGTQSLTIFNKPVQYIRKHFSNHTNNFTFEATNRYAKKIPLLNAGFNIDDGILLGVGHKWINQGFRKKPYASLQQFLGTYSFSTGALRLAFKTEWLQFIKKADFIITGNLLAPANTQNFFGKGNETIFNKTGSFRRFYRTRFNIFNLESGLRWNTGKRSQFFGGLSLQYYHYNPKENNGRFINNTSLIGSYDSLTLEKTKMHVGTTLTFTHDSRNNTLLPAFGSYIKINAESYKGFNTFSKSYAQITADISFYKSIDRKSYFIIANRIGAGATIGNAAFYQSLFLGGQGNLFGYRQFRFAGDHMLYNNLETRIKLTDFASYVLPGQLGLVNTFDIGKVWQKGKRSNEWHQSVGAGFYFAPAQMMLLQIIVAKSDEEWLPHIRLGLRF